MELYSAVKENKMMTFSGIRMELQAILLNETSHIHNIACFLSDAESRFKFINIEVYAHVHVRVCGRTHVRMHVCMYVYGWWKIMVLSAISSE